MQKGILCCIAILILAALRVGAQDAFTDNARKYIQQYRTLAILEQRKNGIPAAITLGQGILETEAGTSELMVNANNHFGIKCKNGWQGETYTYTDDAPDECFKKYRCAEDSYRDHSEHLKRNPRYSPLFSLKATDYKGWSVCLKKCGYATNPQYAQRLIKIIEDFNLEQYTIDALDSSGPQNNNGYNVYLASYKTALPDTIIRRVVTTDTMKRKPAPVRTDAPKIIITHDRHTVKEGETVASIAQMEGMEARQIMEYNFLYPNEEPAPGTILELQKPARRKPDVIIRSTVAHKDNAIVAEERPAGKNDDYIVIDRNKPVSTAAPASRPVVYSESTQSTPAIAQPIASQPPVPRSRLPQQASKPAPANEESDPQRDQQLASMKAELDKVVYADDSKLIEKNTSEPATGPQIKQVAVPAASKGRTFYKVRKGDTAFSIAKKNNITVDQLMHWNNMQTGTVKVGQNLKVKE